MKVNVDSSGTRVTITVPQQRPASSNSQHSPESVRTAIRAIPYDHDKDYSGFLQSMDQPKVYYTRNLYNLTGTHELSFPTFTSMLSSITRSRPLFLRTERNRGGLDEHVVSCTDQTESVYNGHVSYLCSFSQDMLALQPSLQMPNIMQNLDISVYAQPYPSYQNSSSLANNIALHARPLAPLDNSHQRSIQPVLASHNASPDDVLALSPSSISTLIDVKTLPVAVCLLSILNKDYIEESVQQGTEEDEEEEELGERDTATTNANNTHHSTLGVMTTQLGCSALVHITRGSLLIRLCLPEYVKPDAFTTDIDEVGQQHDIAPIFYPSLSSIALPNTEQYVLELYATEKQSIYIPAGAHFTLHPINLLPSTTDKHVMVQFSVSHHLPIPHISKILHKQPHYLDNANIPMLGTCCFNYTYLQKTTFLKIREDGVAISPTMYPCKHTNEQQLSFRKHLWYLAITIPLLRLFWSFTSSNHQQLCTYLQSLDSILGTKHQATANVGHIYSYLLRHILVLENDIDTSVKYNTMEYICPYYNTISRLDDLKHILTYCMTNTAVSSPLTSMMLNTCNNAVPSPESGIGSNNHTMVAPKKEVCLDIIKQLSEKTHQNNIWKCTNPTQTDLSKKEEFKKEEDVSIGSFGINSHISSNLVITPKIKFTLKFGGNNTSSNTSNNNTSMSDMSKTNTPPTSTPLISNTKNIDKNTNNTNNTLDYTYIPPTTRTNSTHTMPPPSIGTMDNTTVMKRKSIYESMYGDEEDETALPPPSKTVRVDTPMVFTQPMVARPAPAYHNKDSFVLEEEEDLFDDFDTPAPPKRKKTTTVNTIKSEKPVKATPGPANTTPIEKKPPTHRKTTQKSGSALHEIKQMAKKFKF